MPNTHSVCPVGKESIEGEMRSTLHWLRLGSFLLCATLPFAAAAQDQAAPTAKQPITEEQIERRYSEKELSTELRKTEETATRPVGESAKGLGRPAFLGAYFAHFVPPLSLRNTNRLANLIRQGKLYLSLHDTILLAVENNLDVEQQRYQIAMADMVLLS